MWRSKRHAARTPRRAYIAKRVGLIPGRAWVGAAAAINMTRTGNQPRNFLRFLNRHDLRCFLVFDDFGRRARVAARRQGIE